MTLPRPLSPDSRPAGDVDMTPTAEETALTSAPTSADAPLPPESPVSGETVADGESATNGSAGPGGPIQARRRPESPRRVRNGLRVRLRFGEEPLAWPAGAWFGLMTDALPAAMRDEGIAYARAGQVVTFGVRMPESNDALVRLEATVQGRSPRPYETVIEIPAWSRVAWEPIIKAMAIEAIYVAKLLGGELPPTVDDVMMVLGKTLLPAASGDLGMRCSCAEGAACKHVVAVACLLAERMIETPLLALTLRGMAGEEVVHRLQEARSLQTHGLATAHAPSAVRLTETRPVEACLLDFWRPGPQLTELDRLESPEHVAHALLRRLGPSPMQGRFPMVGLLASIYDSVRRSAIDLSRTGENDSAE